MFDLTGKSALVTGASGGIGQAIAQVLYGAGAQLGLVGTRANVLEDLAKTLGKRAYPFVSDLSKPEAPDALMAQLEQKMDAPTILVNNAGITRDNLMLRLKDEDWDAVLQTNLNAGFRLCRALLRPMMKARWGRIINITSVVAVTGQGGQSNYAAAKAGMIGMSKSLAQEVASRNITVNCIAPGFIATPMTDILPEERKQAIQAAIPSGRFGRGADIATAVGYLASEEAGYITGQTLHINGGLAMI